MAHYNLEKLAADTRVLRRFARRNIWRAPHRGLGDEAEAAIAAGPRLRREMRRAESHLRRFPHDNDGNPIPVDRAMAQRISDAHTRVGTAREALSENRRVVSEFQGEYDPVRDRINLHGVQDDLARRGPGPRLLTALHENNERIAARGIAAKMRTTLAGAAARNPTADQETYWPRAASDVLPLSTHMTPSVPLRDINIANTATGDNAEELRQYVRHLRRTPHYHNEVTEIAADVPGARALLQSAGMISGGVRPATPGYVAHAANRLQSEGAALSPTVRARLQRMVDTHAANIAPPPARLNRNELRMIDDEFHKKYNPDFPQLLARHAPTPRAPLTPLPAGYLQAYENAIKEEPGLTRKQFLAR